MTRNLSSELVTEITSGQIKPAFFVKLEFDSQTLRYWTGVGDITALGEVYQGIGQLLSVDSIQESTRLQANGVDLIISGLSSTVIALALAENYQNRPVLIYLGALDEDWQLVADPNEYFRGFMDTMRIEEGAESTTVQISCENFLRGLENSEKRSYTLQDQNILYPDDKGFEFIPRLQNQELEWG